MLLNEHELIARIEYARVSANYNKTELAEKMEMNPSTFKRRMSNPLQLTVEEFFKMNDILANGILADYVVEIMGIKVVKKIKKH